MLRLDDYALPLAAAQSQFRERFYGMNAAALREDIHVDALQNFTRKHSPHVVVDRAPRGEKSFDYVVAGTAISHKVGLDVTDIAVLWDATRHIASWSAPHPIVYHLTDRAMRKRRVNVRIEGADISLDAHVRALHEALPAENAKKAERRLAIVHWPADESPARVLEIRDVPCGARTIADVIQFREAWAVVADAMAAGHAPANELDLLLLRSTKREELQGIKVGAMISIDGGLRSGLYGVAAEWMQDVELTRNNRAQLMPRHSVAGFLMKASAAGSFAPLPTWIAPYAAARPPSLYLGQAQSFQQLFD